MFFTQPAAELIPSLPFDLKIKRWAVVERDLESPWFLLTLRALESEFSFTRTLLISDADQLVHMLDDAAASMMITAVMMMEPPMWNGSALWRMEQALSIDSEVENDGEYGRIAVRTESKVYELQTRRKDHARCLYCVAS